MSHGFLRRASTADATVDRVALAQLRFFFLNDHWMGQAHSIPQLFLLL
jgi:hypothetical protein